MPPSLPLLWCCEAAEAVCSACCRSTQVLCPEQGLGPASSPGSGNCSLGSAASLLPRPPSCAVPAQGQVLPTLLTPPCVLLSQGSGSSLCSSAGLVSEQSSAAFHTQLPGGREGLVLYSCSFYESAWAEPAPLPPVPTCGHALCWWAQSCSPCTS